MTLVPRCPPLSREQVEHPRVFETVGTVAAPGEAPGVAVTLLAERGLGARVTLLDARPDHIQAQPFEGVFEEQKLRLGTVAHAAIGSTVEPAPRFRDASDPVDAVQTSLADQLARFPQNNGKLDVRRRVLLGHLAEPVNERDRAVGETTV